MGIVNQDVYSKAAANAVALVVAVENLMDVRVSAGTARVAGADRVLGSDAVHTCTADADDPTVVRGFLVRDTATEAIEVLVDEVVLDGVDAPYSFDDGAYEPLAELFRFAVPAAATDITGEIIVVRRVIEQPQPQP